MRPRLYLLATVLFATPALSAVAQEKPKTQFPGPTDKGFLLPNGWTLSPAGKHVVLTDLPLNILPLADNKHALVATSGYNKHELSLVDFTTQKVADSQTVPGKLVRSGHVAQAGSHLVVGRRSQQVARLQPARRQIDRHRQAS